MQRMTCAVKPQLDFRLADQIVKKFRLRGCKGIATVYRCPECHTFHVGGVQRCFRAEQLRMASQVREQRRSRRLEVA